MADNVYYGDSCWYVDFGEGRAAPSSLGRVNVVRLVRGGFAAPDAPDIPAAPGQACHSAIRRSAPNTRYIVNAKLGTVLDKQTGLTWTRCLEGRSGADCGSGNALRMNWGDALNRAAASTFAGNKDWRMPNSKELESLVEVACFAPAINATVFPNQTATQVWASSPSARSVIGAWSVYFDYGHSGVSYLNYRDYNNAVRLVRGGQ